MRTCKQNADKVVVSSRRVSLVIGVAYSNTLLTEQVIWFWDSYPIPDTHHPHIKHVSRILNLAHFIL